MVKIGVLLSGCGVLDGSEIHEAVITMLELDRAGAEIVCMAPNIDQHHVINHLTQEEMPEKRNVLVESARIARGQIKDVRDVSASDIDGLIIPGGFGAAKNLCDFAFKGPEAKVNPDVERLLKELVEAKKPIGAVCIAPALIAKALSARKPEVTIGTDESTAKAIETMGGLHFSCPVDDIHVDEKNKIVTTPAYMLGPTIKYVAEGIKKLVQKVVEMAKER
ncbi:MAG: isoprenoid biosynthesis glyoxalase ElbB [Syntrophobacterales bacterium]|nr:isoprenoid biosynthesis glyoxalase ElbB [Syntrophobacterales bacterium]